MEKDSPYDDDKVDIDYWSRLGPRAWDDGPGRAGPQQEHA
jgi:hypothetical protein